MWAHRQFKVERTPKGVLTETCCERKVPLRNRHDNRCECGVSARTQVFLLLGAAHMFLAQAVVVRASACDACVSILE